MRSPPPPPPMMMMMPNPTDEFEVSAKEFLLRATPSTPAVTNEDKEFLNLLLPIAEDLIEFGYEPADDGEDDTRIDEYHVMFSHCCNADTPTLYVCRCSDERTVLLTACDFEKEEIRINAPEEWERWSLLLTDEGGLPLEPRTEEEGVRKLGFTYGPNNELVAPFSDDE